MKKISTLLTFLAAVVIFSLIVRYLYLNYKRIDQETPTETISGKLLQSGKIPPKTAVIFYAEQGDQMKYFKQIIKAIQPDSIIVLGPQTPIRLPKGDYDYVIFTGDHGNITEEGKPTQFNGMPIQAFRKALQESSFTAKILILDTCFGAAVIPDFVRAGVLVEGSKAIVPLGEGQGFSPGIIVSYKGKKIKDTFIPLLEALDQQGSRYNAISIYTHGKNQGILYTRFYKNLRAAIQSARFLGVEDQPEEIIAMIQYLKRNRVQVKKISKKKLKEVFQEKLQDAKW